MSALYDKLSLVIAQKCYSNSKDVRLFEFKICDFGMLQYFNAEKNDRAWENHTNCWPIILIEFRMKP